MTRNASPAPTTGPACRHPQREFLGTDQGATFHRCLRCEAIIISQGTRQWVLHAPDRSAAG
jgi:hypothetical protein